MYRKKNRTCATCGKKYAYCSSCYEDRLKPAWMNEFDCEGCKSIFEIATKFNLKMISQSEAQSALNKIVLKPIEQYTKVIQNDIQNIMETPKKTVKHEAIKAKEKNIKEQ